MTFNDLANFKKGPFGSALKKEIFVPKSNNVIKVYEQQNAINKDWKLERYFITKTYYEKMKSFTVYPGDIIVSCAGTIGELYVLPKNADIGIINQALMLIRPNGSIIRKDYFIYIFEKMIDTFTLKFSNGSAIKNIPPFADLKKHKVWIPSLREQDKIVELISKIDDRIQTQSKIIEDLELYKNTIANQLIYNNPLLDKTVPLKEYATLKNGYAFKSDTYSETGNYKVVTIANVTGNKYISTTDCNSIETLPIDIQSHQILKFGDILVSLTGNVGRVSIVNEVNCLLNQRVGVLFFKNIQLKKYLFQVLSNKLFETKMVQKGQGVAQKNIGNEDVESFLIPISNNLEYINKITKVLDALDEKIAIEKQILEKLKEQKKFLLSNMFI